MLNKVNIEEVSQIIDENNPQIVTVQNASRTTRKELEARFTKDYYFLDSYINSSAEATMIRRKKGIFYDAYLSLNSDVEKQLEMMREEDGKYNCQVSVGAFDIHYLSCINVKIDSLLSMTRKYQMEQLQKLLRLHQDSKSNYKTQYQIITGEFMGSDNLEKFCYENNLIDLMRNEKTKEHILINDSLGADYVERSKVKTKGFGEASASVIEITKKKN